VASDRDVEDFTVDVLDYEESVKRVEQEGLDAEEVADAVMGPPSEREVEAAVSR
jgi:hypothetical protein